MAITFVGIGSFATATAGNNLTPSAPTHAAGDALIYWTGEYAGSDTISVPTGWTDIGDSSLAPQCRVFGLIDTNGSASIPSVNWANKTSWAVILALRGVDPNLTLGFSSAGRASVTNGNIVSTGLTPTPSVDKCIVLFGGQHNQLSQHPTYTAPTHFTTAGQSSSGSGNWPSEAIGYWIQGTATTISANIIYTASVTEGSSINFQSVLLCLKPAVDPPGMQLL